MTQADWVKEFMPAWRKFLGYEQYLEKDFVEESGKQWLKAIKGIVKKEVALAQQRTEKKWRESPPEIKTELPFSVTINGVPHILTSISEQNFASLLRFGGEIDGKIILTFTRSDLLK